MGRVLIASNRIEKVGTVKPRFTGHLGGKEICPVNRGAGKSGDPVLGRMEPNF